MGIACGVGYANFFSLVTHTHVDHFDPAASNALVKTVQLLNQPTDKDFFTKEGFTKANVLESSTDWDGIRIQRVDAQHGSGKVLEMMGKTSGFILTAKNQPTIYIVGDGNCCPYGCAGPLPHQQG